MSKMSVSVHEQQPTGQSIYCAIRIGSDRCSIRHNTMYFVCDLQKNIRQCPEWLLSDASGDYREEIINLGYNFHKFIQS